MMRKRSALLAYLLLASVAAVALLLIAVSQVKLANELINVVMVLVGVVVMAAISIVQRLIEQHSGGPTVQINFNEARTKEALREVIDAEFVDAREDIQQGSAPWEPTSESLMALDPSLALAKLRIDLERELRRLAFEYKLDADPKRMTIGRLLHLLLKEKLLAPQAISALNEILPPMNDAVHGGQIDQSVASAVITVGTDILALLRTARPQEFEQSSGL
jgi:hypothetical protein